MLSVDCDTVQVYTVGVSADGLNSLTLTETDPGPLQAQMVIFATGVGYPVIFPGGGYQYALTEGWLNGTVHPAAPVIASVRAHEVYSIPSRSNWPDLQHLMIFLMPHSDCAGAWSFLGWARLDQFLRQCALSECVLGWLVRYSALALSVTCKLIHRANDLLDRRYDIFLVGNLFAFDCYQNQSPPKWQGMQLMRSCPDAALSLTMLAMD